MVQHIRFFHPRCMESRQQIMHKRCSSREISRSNGNRQTRRMLAEEQTPRRAGIMKKTRRHPAKSKLPRTTRTSNSSGGMISRIRLRFRNWQKREPRLLQPSRSSKTRIKARRSDEFTSWSLSTGADSSPMLRMPP